MIAKKITNYSRELVKELQVKSCKFVFKKVIFCPVCDIYNVYEAFSVMVSISIKGREVL